ncbi:thioredoxin [Batrachochytrium salamandrivorans]|nr:thioredoxin [Batrachochytrium salamandrivorans]
MISSGARHFAKFAMRATPKHAMRAMCGSPSRMANLKTTLGPSTLSAFPTRSAISAILSTIPPIGHLGGASPTANTSASSVPQVIKSQDRSMSTTTGTDGAPRDMLTPGATIEEGDDLDAILRQAHKMPVIVDFYASWCGPCRILGPILEKAVASNGKAVLVKINIDEAQEIASRYQVASLPTVAAFKDGVLVDSFLGSRDPTFVAAFVEKITQG